MPATRDRDPVVGTENPLRPPRPLWFNPGGGEGHAILPRPGGPGSGKWEGITAENAEDAEGLRMIPAAPRLARRDPDSVFGGWKGPHPAEARGSGIGKVGRNHRRGRGGRRGSPHDSRGSTPCAPRSGFCFWGVEGPPSCRCPPREIGSLSWVPKTLCVLRALCGSIRGGEGHAILPRPGGPGSGKWEGITAEDAEDTEGLRMIPAAPRLARRDPDFVFGGWKGPHPADARGPRLGTPRGCRQPSASSVFSVVQSG